MTIDPSSSITYLRFGCPFIWVWHHHVQYEPLAEKIVSVHAILRVYFKLIGEYFIALIVETMLRFQLSSDVSANPIGYAQITAHGSGNPT
ncbi:CLUMA_CG018575, isoform A [Clunio marinus]|uniref:CLUMA_CG018575, isoform A n=1 Tax=Clunio marinus TaxID=568069 RepID=A0A1J1J397_9DIPT|nr:CLUMA_CG018575, isoform A [Clunio marinus]